MKKMDKRSFGLAVAGIAVLMAAFYGGMVYGKSGQAKISTRGQGLAAFAGGAFSGRSGGRSARNTGGFTAGEIIAKDDKSITVKLQDGGSKIVFLGNATKISKSTAGSVVDLSTGTQVSVMGTPNTDGSMNAQTVQIRPQTSAAQTF